jgi:hypothetical protein
MFGQHNLLFATKVEKDFEISVKTLYYNIYYI